MRQKYFVPYNAEHGTNAVNIGKGGNAPQYENNNVLDEGEIVKTTRTGVGLGDGFTGTKPPYSSYSMSSSSSSAPSSSSSSSSSSSFSSSSSSSSFSCSSSSFSSSSESAFPATISVITPFARLKSGGNSGTAPQDYTITIQSNQALSAPPTLVAPMGAWQGAFTGGPLNWTCALRIHDDDAKGTQTWGALDAVNMYGMHTTDITGDDQYVVGGFVFRVLTVAAWPNREAAIGTTVVDTSKLRCTNLSEGDSGDLNFTFETAVQNSADHYTITNPTGIYNATGNLWRNNDLSNAVSNTSGTMQIELEEIV